MFIEIQLNKFTLVKVDKNANPIKNTFIPNLVGARGGDVILPRAKFGIPNLSQSPDIGQNSDGGISDFRISGQFLIKENCHNSRNSDDIYMKLGPVTKIDKRNKTKSKNFDDDEMSENYDAIVVFRIFVQFGAVRRTDSGHRVCKSYVFGNSHLLSYKN